MCEGQGNPHSSRSERRALALPSSEPGLSAADSSSLIWSGSAVLLNRSLNPIRARQGERERETGPRSPGHRRGGGAIVLTRPQPRASEANFELRILPGPGALVTCGPPRPRRGAKIGAPATPTTPTSRAETHCPSHWCPLELKGGSGRGAALRAPAKAAVTPEQRRHRCPLRDLPANS